MKENLVIGNGGIGDTSEIYHGTVEICKKWIWKNTSPLRNINRTISSYGWKHKVERDLEGKYIPNGAFIKAAIELGYDYEPDGTNAYFNMWSDKFRKSKIKKEDVISSFEEYSKEYIEYSDLKFPELEHEELDLLKIISWRLHDSNKQTLNSIKRLLESDLIIDAYVLCRSMFESMLFIGAMNSGIIENAHNRYFDYADIQKYKILDKYSKLNEEKKEKDILEEATKKLWAKEYGQNTRNWSGIDNYSLAEKLDKEYNTYDDENIFQNLYINIYSYGSTFVHKNYNIFDWVYSYEIDGNTVYRYINYDIVTDLIIESLLIFLFSLKFSANAFKIEDINDYCLKEKRRILELRKTLFSVYYI